jgi:hypothetical protein
MKQIISRMQKPTPAFFKQVRNIGLAMAAISASILAAPVALPVIVVKVAGYLAVAGGVMTTISQSAVKMEKK